MAERSEDFLRQLRRVNAERYQVWASRPLMLCEHCGATEHAETEQCAPPFNVQPHSFTKPHPSLTVENDAGIMFDAIELGGELGELLNVVKKLEREERGWRGSRADPADFADECADVLICLDKLARRHGVDLIAATTAKFNATSDKVGLPHKLSTLSAGKGELRDEIRKEIINTPETADFMAGVPLEAAHQRERWGVSHDGGKTPFDWFWLIGYLAQKAADAATRGDSEKAKHHTISTGAALANWHAALTGADNRMRPGIATPASHGSGGKA